jgi:hypothetical protein
MMLALIENTYDTQLYFPRENHKVGL